MPIALTTLAVGVACLFAGGHLLVRGASQLALRLELSPLFVGLTVVAFGTSLPELMVTVLADLRGAPEIAVGNVVGSNIANLGLVLGTAALVFPLVLNAASTLRHLAASVAATLLAGLFFLNGILSRIEGAVLLLGLLVYLVVAYRYGHRSEGISTDAMMRAVPALPTSDLLPAVTKSVVGVIIGLAILLAGANWAIDGAVAIAELAGLAESVVGLTVVAVGTSLPELATSVVAAWKREAAISVGNILGSNTFNMLGILGISAVARPMPIASRIIEFDMPMVIAFSLLTLLVMLSGRRVSRPEGLLLLGCYAFYCGWLFL